MPVIFDKDNAPDALKGKNSDDKSTSDQVKAKAEDFISKGPAIQSEMPPAASKDELKARKEELNKE